MKGPLERVRNHIEEQYQKWKKDLSPEDRKLIEETEVGEENHISPHIINTTKKNFQQLPIRIRAVVVLYNSRAFTKREIAIIMKVSDGTIAQHIKDLHL